MSNSEKPRWLIVTLEEHRALAEVLRDRFEALGLVVLLERNCAERLPGTAERDVEWRGAGRRQRRPIAWVFPCLPSDVLGPDMRQFDLGSVPTPAPPPDGLVAEACPECGITIEFKMPHADPPADRIETRVAHRTDQTFGVQHYVEISAFAASGPPARQRIQAQRQMPRR